MDRVTEKRMSGYSQFLIPNSSFLTQLYHPSPLLHSQSHIPSPAKFQRFNTELLHGAGGVCYNSSVKRTFADSRGG